MTGIQVGIKCLMAGCVRFLPHGVNSHEQMPISNSLRKCQGQGDEINLEIANVDGKLQPFVRIEYVPRGGYRLYDHRRRHLIVIGVSGIYRVDIRTRREPEPTIGGPNQRR
jgi:hypothetical protein